MARSSRVKVSMSGTDDINKLRLRLWGLTKKEVHVGMQGDAELAMIAAVHEYGSAKMGIPARSFIRSGRMKSRIPVGKIVRAGVTEIAFGRKRAGVLLEEAGRTGLDRTIKNFERIKQPPLSARYKAERGGGRKLLQRDKDLRESLTYVIKKKR
ncbi:MULTISPECIES: hypothetical protein [unclassified Paenibacillus]|uniref:hypothetical protein n=1 Tax=unclassified Paenibacillus TaxID=185978 RepID=UPI000955F820|nr:MULTISPECIES: hypothetical protein [unclassified Paenibacillus]ASS66380.1 hypothetical protein CIC07_09610 [Paenibacillus sp. RUD330]SIQ06200.1 hypothetical protein SAMN05880555_0499 [Paenibacillus sp. RU4X]SIQ26334.1 hypothetical protein SAMN05880570_0498 [Paenibacillus sp. RU4T]